MSFHLPHILLNTLHPPEQLDRAFLGIFGPETGTTKGTEAPGLYRSCSSVILTLVSPTPTTSQEEALNLLTDPEALWTVLLINAPLRMADELRLEPEQHMTPIAQYIRGICGTVVAQRIHITRVVDELKGRINETVGPTCNSNQHINHRLLTNLVLISFILPRRWAAQMGNRISTISLTTSRSPNQDCTIGLSKHAMRYSKA